MILNGCSTTHIFCRPNCPPGRRTRLEHRVQFLSLSIAIAAGYRACRVCKPDDESIGPPGQAWVSKANRKVSDHRY